MKTKFYNNRGFSLVELTIAMVVGSIVITGAFKTQVLITKGAVRENQKSSIQQSIMSVGEMVEKDIRMAGYGVPGNGISVELSDTSNDKITLFVNSARTVTTVTKQVNPADSVVCVEDCQTAKANQWVCLSAADTVFRKIVRVGKGANPPDTLYLESSVGNTFSTTQTSVYITSQIKYTIQAGTSRTFCRIKDGKTYPVCANLDTMNIIPRDSTGAVASAPYTSVRMLDVQIGSWVGTGSNKTLQSENVSVMIRNKF